MSDHHWTYILSRASKLSERNAALAIAFVEARHARGPKLKTLTHYVDWLVHFERATGRTDFVRTGAEDVVRFLTYVRTATTAAGKRFGPRSTHQASIHAKAFFRWLWRDEPKPFSLWDAFRVTDRLPPNRKPIVTPEELNALVQACGSLRDRAIIALLYGLGLRRSELVGLRVGSVIFDEEGGLFCRLPDHVDGMKTGSREAYMLDERGLVKDYLGSHAHRQDSEAPLFPPLHPGEGDSLHANGVNQLLRKLCAQAGTRLINPHLFRKTRATITSRANWDDTKKKRFFGWSNGSSMPALYAEIDAEDLKQQVLRDRPRRVEPAAPIPASTAQQDLAATVAAAVAAALAATANRSA